MTEERLKEIMEADREGKWDGDNAFQGLQILTKYSNGKDVLRGAEHDIIFSIDLEQAIENGITEEDAIKLRNLNWMVDEWGEGFACFV